jgi:hypothetical protein
MKRSLFKLPKLLKPLGIENLSLDTQKNMYFKIPLFN